MRYTVKTISFYFVMATLTAGLFANDSVKKEHQPEHKKEELERAGHDIVPGFVETKPINDVIHSVVPREQQQAGKASINRVQVNTNYGEPRKDYTRVELEKLLERAKTTKGSLSQEELNVVEEYFLDIERQKDPDVKQNNTVGYHRSSRTATDLFFSEYAEGSSNNKYLEIYNGTGANVDLSSYLIMQASNNGPWDEYVDTLSGTLANGDVYVIANSSASEDILAEADLLGSGICYFNGDDARALIKVVSGDTTILDYIGVFYLTAGGDDDPVSGWDVAGVTDATKDHTLVRKSSVTSGNTSWSASAGTSTSDSEWSVEDRPTADYTPLTLGSHNMVDPALFVLNEGFEGSTFPPAGWQAISMNTGNSVTQSSTYPHTGSYAVRFSSYSSGGGSSPDYTQYLISPKLSVVSGDSLAFWYRKHYSFYTDNVYVGISTTDSSAASFTFGDALSISTTYARHAQDLSSHAGSDIFVALKYYGSFAGHLYVDDITGPGQAVSSSPVAALSATTVAFGTVNTSVTDTVSVTLTNNGGANLNTTMSSDNTLFTASPATMVLIPGTSGTVNIIYSPSAAVASSGNIIFTHNGVSSPDSVAVSGTGTTSLLVEGFENNAWTGTPAAPPNWSQITVSGTNAWQRYNYSYYAHTGSYSAKAPWASAGGEHLLITPGLNLGDGTDGYKLVFWLDGTTSSGTDLYVQISSSNATEGEFTDTLATYIAGSSVTPMPTTYAEQSINLTGYTGTQYIAFRMVDANGYSLYIDDIEVELIPPQPTLSLSIESVKLSPTTIGHTSQSVAFYVGGNSGAGALVVDSITTSNSDYSVALTTMATGDTVVAGGTVDLDISWTPSSFGLTSGNVIIYHNASTSPDTFSLSGEAGYQYVDFDDQSFPLGWTVIDNDTVNAYGYDDGWNFYSYNAIGYSGYYGYYARSHYNVDGSDDWMITSKLTPVSGDSVIFRHNSSNYGDVLDTLHVYVSTTDNEMASFTTEIGEILSDGYNTKRTALDLGTYAGSDIYVAIVHHGTVGTNYYSYRRVDDVLLPAKWINPEVETILSTDTLDFGGAFANYAKTETFTITNNGAPDLAITGFTSDNAEVTVSPATATLAYDSSATFTVTLTATTLSDTGSATLTIASNDAENPTVAVNWITAAYDLTEFTLSTGLNDTVSTTYYSGSYVYNEAHDTIHIQDDTGLMASMMVFVDLDHTYMYGMELTLTAPNGDSVLFFDNMSGYDGMYTVVLDGGSNTSAPFFPDAPATNSLNGLVGGMNPAGNWALKVRDGYSGYVAVLKGWGIKYIEGPSGFITGTVTNSETGMAIDSALVSSGGLAYTDALGSYTLESLAGARSVSITKTGYNPAFFTVTVDTGDTAVQDVALMPLDIQQMFFTGFETGDDLGSSDTSALDNYFTVVDTFINAQSDTILPNDGSGMLVYPAGGGEYGNNEVVHWVADSVYDISGYGAVYMKLDANYYTENCCDEFHIGLEVDSGVVIWDVADDIKGASDGWETVVVDLSWVLALGHTMVRPAITFDSDGSVTYYGGAFDNIAIEANPFYLAPPGHIMATSYGSDIPLSWEAPADEGRVSYNLQYFNVEDMADLHRPMVMGPDGEMVEATKGPIQYETLTVDYEYSNSSTRSLVGYNVFRSSWPFGEEDVLIGSSATNFYVDAGVADGDYYDYWVEAVYYEGTSPPGANKASARAGTPYVMVVDSFGVADFDSTIGEHWEQFSSGTATWVVGDVSDAQNAFYPNASSNYVDSLNNSPDTNFAMISDGRNGDAILISPFLDFTHHQSAVLALDGFALMYTSSQYSDYGSAKIKARADMGEWVEVLDLSYNHNNGWEHEMVDVSWVAGHDKVQFAFGYNQGVYTTYYGNGMAIDNVDIHAVPGLTSLTATGTEESVELSWSGGRSVSLDPDWVPLSHEEKMLLIEESASTNEGIISDELSLVNRHDIVSSDIRPASTRQGGDTFADAVEITVPYYGSGTTVGYTNDYGPFDDDADLICGDYTSTYWGNASDVVYKLILPDTAHVVIDLDGSLYDTALGVYDSTDTALVLANDDYNGLQSYLECILPTGTYYIVVDGYSSNNGSYTIDVHTVEPLPDLLYNVYKDGNLIAEGLADTILTYTDNNVGLYEACYTVTASILERWSDTGPDTSHVYAHIESDHSNEACASMQNTPPGAFALITPPDGEELVITNDNIGDLQVFAWSQSVDPNGYDINYHILWETETDTGMFQIWDDTTGTAVAIPLGLMAEVMTGLSELTGEYIADFSWTVWADDGLDEVQASNGPRTISIDVGWYLGINGEAAIPDIFALHQNYPNPFNPVTTIRYDVAEQAHVQMDIYNLLGQKVAVVVNGVHEPGFHAVRWNGTNMYGNALSSGMYFYHIQAGDFRSIKKLILVK